MEFNSTQKAAILKILLESAPKTKEELARTKRHIAKQLGIPVFFNSTLLTIYREAILAGSVPDTTLLSVLKKAEVRSLSGVAVITVLTKPYMCPGKCVYCPTEPNMPKSYLSNEPAAMRAVHHEFDPYDQTFQRLVALDRNGHITDKLELIVLGGTWSAYSKIYQTWFIRECMRAASDFPHYDKFSGRATTPEEELLPSEPDWLTHSFNHEVLRAETAPHRIIGLCLETRPDWVDDEEIARLRWLGCTRIQLGLQSMYNDVLDLIKRGHHVEELTATAGKFRDAGFKIDMHIMPNLPGSTVERDIAMCREIFTSADFQPDQVKIYPCIVNEYAELHQWWKEGRYRPYTDEENMRMLIEIVRLIPYHTRVNRLIRDIPGESIVAGNTITNLREHIEKRMRDEGIISRDIRSCEARGRTALAHEAQLFNDTYEAQGGTEYFLNFANHDRTILYALCRLRLPNKEKSHIHPLPELRDAALIREVHTYGRLAALTGEKTEGFQHEGFGKRLMREAEDIARSAGYAKMAVIAGVGVREYYAKLGYRKEGTYMVKSL